VDAVSVCDVFSVEPWDARRELPVLEEDLGGGACCSSVLLLLLLLLLSDEDDVEDALLLFGLMDEVEGEGDLPLSAVRSGFGLDRTFALETTHRSKYSDLIRYRSNVKTTSRTQMIFWRKERGVKSWEMIDHSALSVSPQAY
jgi:hypothetical protein